MNIHNVPIRTRSNWFSVLLNLRIRIGLGILRCGAAAPTGAPRHISAGRNPDSGRAVICAASTCTLDSQNRMESCGRAATTKSRPSLGNSRRIRPEARLNREIIAAEGHRRSRLGRKSDWSQVSGRGDFELYYSEINRR